MIKEGGETAAAEKDREGNQGKWGGRGNANNKWRYESCGPRERIQVTASAVSYTMGRGDG